jgi:hypothetical protein
MHTVTRKLSVDILLVFVPAPSQQLDPNRHHSGADDQTSSLQQPYQKPTGRRQQQQRQPVRTGCEPIVLTRQHVIHCCHYGWLLYLGFRVPNPTAQDIESAIHSIARRQQHGLQPGTG